MRTLFYLLYLIDFVRIINVSDGVWESLLIFVCLSVNGVGEEYFSTISSPARKVIQDVVQIRNGRDKSWHDLSRSSGGTEDAGLLIGEGFEQPSSTIVAAPKAQKYHTLGSRSRNKNKHQKQQVISTVIWTKDSLVFF